ncbi:mitochondrial 18 KDa protein-domain-containing protein [Globomyces pollinis-pini]|nr:mitochondrial 18 KDa protein-domain-containing protein [Globomyces pollinis-pini]
MKDEPQEIQETTDSAIRYLGYAGRITNFVNSGSRYLAYTSDIGEAFRPVVKPSIVRLAYGVSFAYVGFDVGLEAYKSRVRGDTSVETGRVVLQRSIFQILASLALPALTIHTAVDFAAKQMKKYPQYPRLLKFGPTGLGLALIPALPIMFDDPIEIAMEKAFDYAWPLSEEAHQRAHHHHKSE